MLNENAVPNPNSHVARPVQMEACLRVILKFSIIIVTAGSISEIDDVQAAISSKIKKSVPKRVPPVMLPNATGIVSKIKLGPAPISRALAKTMGKIAMPAIRATIVSEIAMATEVVAIDVPLGT